MNTGNRRITKIFLGACDLDGEERRSFLDEAYAGDPASRAEVESLLAHDDRAPEILRTGGAVSRGARLIDPLPCSIGPYEVIEKLGEGGMGVVYRGEQKAPFLRQAAVKRIKLGIDTKEVIARFDSERQALAMMNHPNIARVFDAGSTEQGRPYFAMEYVDGEPITDYCDARRLPLAERLDLFTQVCEGVQHAHHRAIIHRDLKPTNILVATQDGRPVPKIIDFGVAKALDHRLTRRNLTLESGAFVGTPEYMSPEQAAMNGHTVDTRTDVYSLGVLLYELIAGSQPVAAGRIGDAAPEEVRRLVQEIEPPRPSARVEGGGRESAAAAGKRGIDPATLAKRLRGDLDWITMKALEKNPSRRYGSPSELAADVQRHLRDEPVLASPPSRVYRVRKFVAKHKAGVGFAAAVLLLLVGFATTMTVQAGRIVQERDRASEQAATAEEVKGFLVDLFEVPTRIGARIDLTTSDALLVDGAEKVRRELANRPLLQAELFHTMGEVNRRTSHPERARKLLEDGYALLRELLGPEHPKTLSCRRSLAKLYESSGLFDEAESLYLETLEMKRRVLGVGHVGTLRAMNDLAYLYKLWDRQSEAEPLFVRTLNGLRRELGRDHPETLISAGFLAGVWLDQRRYDELEPLLLELTDRMPEVLGWDHLETQAAVYNLGCLYANTGRREWALDRLDQAVEAGFVFGGRLYGDVHLSPLHQDPEFRPIARKAWLNGPYTWAPTRSRAASAMAREQFEEAESLYLEVLAAMRRLGIGNENDDLMMTRHSLADVYLRQERWDDAGRILLQSIELLRQEFGGEHQAVIDATWFLAQTYLGKGETDRALASIERVAEAYSRRFPETSGAVAYLQADLCALRGDRKCALRNLRVVADLVYEDGAGMAEDLAFRSLRGDPEFEAIVETFAERLEL